MNCIEQILSHRSIRQYKSDPVDPETLEKILEAALRASSSGNMQTQSIIVTRDEEKKKQLWDYHLKQDMILQAPILLTFCADWHRMIQWCELSNANPGYDNHFSFMVSVGDAFIAAQNAALAAESFGLGICYMGTTLYSARKIAELLKCPKHVVPITTLVVGHPDEKPDLRDRLPLNSVVHQEEYQDFSDDDIKTVYHQRETAGWERYKTVPRLKEMIETSGVENLAQVYTQLKYTKENNERMSDEFLGFLKDQGFF